MTRLLLIGAILVGISACATTLSAPPTVDVTGSWAGQWAYEHANLGSGSITMNVKQVGAEVSGDMVVTGAQIDRTGPLSALVSGNQIRIMRPTSITGRLTVQGDTISGVIDGLEPANVSLKRVR